MGNPYAYALRYFLLAVCLVFVTDTLILDGADEKRRFDAVLGAFVLPVICVNVAVYAIVSLAIGIGKLDPAGRVYRPYPWIAWGSMAAAFTWAIVAAKLATAS